MELDFTGRQYITRRSPQVIQQEKLTIRQEEDPI